MNQEKIDICNSLISWFQELHKTENPNDLTDGVAMARVLHQISPENFSANWLAKIKFEVGSNWRLKVSNLKKVVESIMDYYSDVLNLTLTDLRPDVTKIAENNDRIELGRLLQLILGCAVNCTRKQDYITQIMDLEESLQRNIMQAIQELEPIWQGTMPPVSITMPFDQKIGQTNDRDRDALAQRCHEAERKIALLLDEKLSLQHENSKILQELEKYQNTTTIGDDGISLGPVQPGSSRYTELRRQLDTLKDELLLAETSRDDFKIKSQQQASEICSLHTKIEELTQSTAELAVLKDEIDVLRETNGQLKIYEAQLATYKKKLEDYNDIKRQIKLLEERSAEHYQQNVQQEENLKKFASFKGQVELYKKQIEDLNTKLEEEMMKNVKTEFERNNFGEKLTTLQREKDSLMNERDALRETCDELRCNQLVPGGDHAAVSREIVPAWKEKIERLEAENRALRSGATGEDILANYMDETNQRTEKLREQLKQANQKILTLSQPQSDDAKGNELTLQLKQSIELNEQKGTQLDDAHSQIAKLQAKLSQLESLISTRDQELSAKDALYKKSVEKAKEIIKSYDPKALLPDAAMSDKGIDVDSDAIRPSMGAVEEKLIATAFYRLTTACQREAVDARLALNSGGQSFLTRQRQPAPRKPNNLSFKPK